MELELPDDFKEFLASLDERGVEHLKQKRHRQIVDGVSAIHCYRLRLPEIIVK